MKRPGRALAFFAGTLLLFGATAGARRHAPRRREPPPSLPAASPWSSPEACAAALESHRSKPRGPGTARIGTWNVRWFPDGAPGTGPDRGEHATNVEWLACAIAWLDVDVLALQEIKNTPSASAALATLVKELDARTGGHFRVQLDHCPGLGRQSVALLFDERRVTARGFHDVDELNPGGHACDEHLRPGLAGYFRFPGGADAHLVAVHLKSGAEPRDRELREKSLAGFGAAQASLQSTERDSDVIVLGDFNTMGCEGCTPPSDAAEESASTRSELLRGSPAFRLLDTDRSCSEYHRGMGTLLDHVAVSDGMREVSPGVRARVEGYCAEVSCRALPRRSMPRAYGELSDHCPIVVDFDDRDLD